MKKAYIQLHLALVLAGFTGIFGRLITLNEGLISWYRTFISAVFILIVLTLTGKFQKITLSEKIKMGAAGAILGFHWLFFYGSIKYSNISVGVVCFALTSFFNALFEPAINKKKLSIQELLLSGLTLCGIALIFGMDISFRTGIILGIISSIFSALYTVYNERLAGNYRGETIILYQLIGGVIALTLIMPAFLYFTPTTSLLPSLHDFGWLLVLAILCTVVMYLLIINALKHISSFTVSLTFNLEPLYTILLAIVIYKENKVLSTSFYIGLFLILTSLGLQMCRVWYKLKSRQLTTISH
ncbi:DMT family transporter [Pedobacter soli]|uniref:EamA domain-containing membrane protein RarD n=1 Tax=Pedobacter soli TaxID=390242 RepID=A0A1G6VTY7_9SPHI|nr:DMT family transporter [Pedobacter soli]SDD56295.1 EamA domain-containing membrane protein RarD [Pedobacter soli]